MIYDSFQFFNELELLEIRLNTHNNYVDKFIITECTTTHSGKPKPLFYLKNKNLFKEFEHKIIHFVLDEFPSDFPTDDVFVKDIYHHNLIQLRDTYQRMYFLHNSNFEEDDIIFLLDLDEIINFKKLNNIDKNKINSLTLKNYYYYINNESSYTSDGGIMSKYKLIKNVVGDNKFMNLRQWSKYNKNTINYTTDTVGWHFSFLGGLSEIKYKIESWAHPEYNTEKIKEGIQKHLIDNTDIFNRENHNYRTIPLDDSFPEYVINNKLKFSKLIYQF